MAVATEWLRTLATIAVGIASLLLVCWLLLKRTTRAKDAAHAALVAQLPGDASDRGKFHATREASFVPLVEKHGRTFAYHVDEVGNFGTMRGKTMVATCDPKLVREILSKRVHTEHRPEQYRLARFLPGLDGVLFQEGEVWEKHTRALFPLFQGKHFGTLGGELRQIAARSIATWGSADRRRSTGDGPTDVLPLLHEIVTQCIVRVGFGLAPESTTGVKIAEALTTFMETEHALRVSGFEQMSACARITAFAQAFRWFSRDFKHVRGAVQPVLELAAAIESCAASGSVRSEGWIQLMQIARIDEAAIASEVNHLHDAHKALAVVLTFALYRLARPGAAPWAALMRRERAAALASCADGPTGFTRVELAKLPVTRAVFREVLRMHTISMGVVRTTGAAVKARVGKGAAERDVTVPKGTDVLLLLHALHHLPTLWDRPLTFDPARWLTIDGAPCTAAAIAALTEEAEDAGEERSAAAAAAAAAGRGGALEVVGPHTKWTWFPFLDGKRQCAGRMLAEFEFTIVLHEVLDAFDVEEALAPLDFELRLAPDFYPVPEAPVRLHLRQRRAHSGGP